MSRVNAMARTPFGSAVVGGLVVGLLGYLAIAAGWIGTKKEYGLSAPEAPLLKPASDRSAKGNSVNQIYRADAPGVAFIEAESAPQSNSPFDFFGQQQRGPATGSGFVIDTDGHVLTNAHVVAGADRIRVSLGSDKNFVDAHKVGEDPSTDIALLKVNVDKSKLHPLRLGDSSKLAVGDPVVAIGNPFGLDRTVTSGIVSALQRQIDAPNHFTIDNVIQTDAPINPGNSGGPLLDGAGEVIGINSQIETGGSGGSVGIGFAIPINTARQVVTQLLRTGEVQHAFLGITGTTIDPSISKALNLPADKGVLVQDAFKGGPADRAGIRGGSTQATLDGQNLLLGGDIITAVDGKDVTDMQQIVHTVETKQPGDKMQIEVLRGGQHQSFTVTLGERPQHIQDSEQLFNR
jgi:S1-C subfamily serine protease